ncbi:unnamed protein product [Linum trigynum]|uniref:Uncharacterized protein n=1 Tax=Linum trigynum TaxID=586398 RepID=A0AAV2FWJ3_9ROSI
MLGSIGTGTLTPHKLGRTLATGGSAIGDDGRFEALAELLTNGCGVCLIVQQLNIGATLGRRGRGLLSEEWQAGHN